MKKKGSRKDTSGQFRPEKGAVVWAKSKRWPEWPGIVTCVYPKNISIHWLPFPEIDIKPPTFKFSYSDIRPFLASDKLPEGKKDDDLTRAMEVAHNLLKKAKPDQRIPASVQRKAPQIDSSKPKPSFEYIVVKGEEEVGVPGEFDLYSRVKERARKSLDDVCGQAPGGLEESKDQPVEPIAVVKPEQNAEVPDPKSVSEVKETVELLKTEEPTKKGRGRPKSTEKKPKESTAKQKLAKSNNSAKFSVPDKPKPKPQSQPRLVEKKSKRGEAKSDLQSKNVQLHQTEQQSGSQTVPSAENQADSLDVEEKIGEIVEEKREEVKVQKRRPGRPPKRQNQDQSDTTGKRDDSKVPLKKRKAVAAAATAPKKTAANKRSTSGDRMTGKLSDTETEFPSLARLSSGHEEVDPNKPKFCRGDVVWVKYRRYQAWPCLVTKYDKKKKKVSFEFLPVEARNRNTKFRVPESKAENFMTAYYRHFTAANLDDLEILNAVKEADKIRKHEMNPFACDTISSRALKDEVSLFAKFRTNQDLPSMDDDLPSVRHSDDNEEHERSESPENATGKRAEENKQLMNKIMSEDTKEFLGQVYNEEIVNKRQEVWNVHQARMPAPKSFGPIVDEDQIEDLVETLSAWYQDVNPDASVRNTFAYIACVWLPEAVKYAMQVALGYTEEEAEKTLNASPTNYSSKELDETATNMLDVAKESENGTAFDKLVEVACRERDSL